MEPLGEMTLTTFIEPKDEIDQKIVCDTINMVIALNTNDILFQGNKKLSEAYFGKTMDLAQSLLKANEHLRSYLQKEKELISTHLEKSLNNPNKHTNLGINPITLNNEIDGVLSQIKAALDMLATTLNPMFGLSLNGWRKDGKGKSGVFILKALDNLPKQIKENTKDLRDYIEKNSGYISYIVYLRDMPIHQGGVKNISSILFDFKTQKVIAQKITHSDNNIEFVNEFLIRTMEGIILFINGVLALSMQAKMGNALLISKNDPESYPPYSWRFGNVAIK